MKRVKGRQGVGEAALRSSGGGRNNGSEEIDLTGPIPA